MKYKILPIRLSFLSRAREEGLDDQNQPVEYVEALGGEPCRDVLRGARPGEPLILASYCPFKRSSPYKEFGPVYILRHASDEAFNDTQFPSPVGADIDYLGDSFVLRAYCKNERIVDAKVSSPCSVESDLEGFLENELVRFILVRFVAYGCYGLRVERST